jgi:isoleucyl-tRNA synthetase
VVLTHGFTMDSKGLKMSKSLGNTISPLKIMETNGADIIRLWALSVDFTEDHRIGDEILKGVADQYRKLRNTFRYLLGALEGFADQERVTDVAAMPELDRYMLSLLAKLDADLKRAVDDFDFNSYTRLLADFCNEDLSAFYFDIRKDRLYCDINLSTGKQTPERAAYRTVLDTLFHALVRYAAPVLVFTAEEVWGTRYPDAGSVHLLEWPTLPSLPEADGGARDIAGLNNIERKWDRIRNARTRVTEAIEPLRREKAIRSSLEAEVLMGDGFVASEDGSNDELAEVFISAKVQHKPGHDGITITPTTDHKCGRCWRHLPEVTAEGALCKRCETVLDAA